MLKAIIVDDEILAIHLLESMLKASGAVDVIGTFLNPREALTSIDLLKPDILFLDIEMPEMTGIELASKIEKSSYRMDTVFVTAYEHYALEAFDVRATDYILKPIDNNRLLKTIDRLSQRKHQWEAKDLLAQSNTEFSGDFPSNDDATVIHTLHFHIHSGKVSISDTALTLSTKEFQILFFLAQHSDQTYTASELYTLIWDEESFGQTQVLRVHISNLRKKLNAIPGQPAKIVMVRGHGYQLVFQ